MLLSKNTGLLSLYPIIYFQQIVVPTIITYQNDPYLNYVVLNINGDTVSSGNNNTFLDSGFCNLTPTTNPTQGTFSPFSPVGWSVYFDANNYLSIPNNTSLNFLNSAFTIEFWFRPAANNVNYDFLGKFGTEYIIQYRTNLTGGKGFRFAFNSSVYIDCVYNAISANVWHHYAISKDSGGVYRMFINGTQIGSNITNTTSITDTTTDLLLGRVTTSPQQYVGYMSNLRILKGTALYTANFTPISSEPLKLLPNTSLLTLQNGYLVDNSRNKSAINVTGILYVRPFSVNIPSVDYTPSIHGGGAYFNGSSYLEIPSNSALAFPNGTNFTIEFWVNFSTNTNRFFMINNLGATFYIDNLFPIFGTYAGSTILTSTVSLKHNIWYHIAITRSGTTSRMFVNGIQTAIRTNDSTSYAGNALRIGSDFGTPTPTYTFGYASNIRVVKGQAVYTSNFTPPTSPVTSTTNGGALYNNTLVPNLSVTPSLLLDFDNGGIIDRSFKNNVLVVGDTKTQTISSKFGTGSIYFDGTGDYLEIPNNLNLALENNDFTIEFWINRVGTGQQHIIDWRSTTNDNTRPVIYHKIGTNSIAYFFNTTDRLTATLTQNTWNHVAVVRQSSNTRMFVNGVSALTSYSDTNNYPQPTTNLKIGANATNADLLNGYLEDLRITTGVARYTSNFTVPAKLQANNSDPFFNNVVLFLDGNNIGSSINKGFRGTAGEAVRLPITRSGSVTQGSFTPFSPNGWSGYFDGGSYLTITDNNAFSFGTGDFTIECYAYMTNAAMTYPTILEIGNHGNNTGIAFWMQQGVNNLTPQIWSGTGVAPTNTPKLTINSWNHVVWQRISGNLKIYVNGVGSNTIAFANNLTDTALISIGYPAKNAGVIGSYAFNGYVSNLRIVKGRALYTSNFTPPTGPLPALSGSGFSTSLLTLQDNRFKDNSTNNFTLTSAGTTPPAVQAFNPFKQTTVYTPSIHGSSGYFDGLSYLTIPANASFALDGDFTIECWVNTSVFSTESGYIRHIISMGTGTDNANLLKISLLTTAGAASINLSLYTTSVILLGTIPVADGRWHHVVVVRSGTSLRLYIDGVQSGTTATTTQSFNAGATSNIRIGCINNAEAGRFNGYISNLRIVKGRALYTSAFTPLTSPVSAVNGTSLLLNFDNSYIIDSTGNNVITTVGDSRTNVLSTAPLSSSTGSLYFDGTGDYLDIRNSENFNFRTGDFTIEFWLRPNFSTGTGCRGGIVSTAHANNATLGFLVYRDFAVNEGQPMVRFAGNATDYSSGVVAPAHTWSHWALTRSGTTLRWFKDGVLTATHLNRNEDINNTNNLYIGRAAVWDYYHNGLIDDLRITKGVARYKESFTPPIYRNPTFNLLTYPTDPYKNYVVLDINADTVNNEQNNTFLDKSGNNLTITRTGSTTQGSFSPFSPNGWSGYFNGSSYLSIANTTSLNLASSPFTIEAWIYRMADAPTGGVIQVFVGKRILADPFTQSYYLGTDSNNGLVFYTGQSRVLSGGFLPKNQWTHITVSYNGTQGSLYVNGNSVSGPATFSVTEQNVPIYIGYYPTTPTSIFTGYISNLRIVKGQALYTSNFTPLTAALTTTSTISGVTLSAENVSLLTLQDNRFKDNSNNNFTLTVNGAPSNKPFSPFQPTANYSPTIHGGSGYFNGNTSYLSAGNNLMNFGSSNWTVEAWVYLNAMPTSDTFPSNWPQTMTLIGVGSPSTADGITCFIGATKLLIQSNDIGYVSSNTHGITINTWNHLAYVRNGNNIFFYVNGIPKGSIAFTGSVATGSATIIGAFRTGGGSFLNGYIYNLRVVKEAAIIPPVGGPTAPVQAVSGTSLLLNFDNAGVVDSSGKNNITSYGDAKIDYSIKKYGFGSLKFDGTGDYMQSGVASDWTFLHTTNAKWTIDFWIYSNSSGIGTILDTNGSTLGAHGISLQKQANNTLDLFVTHGTLGSVIIRATTTETIPLTTWTHVAITYDHTLASNNMFVFINGLSSISANKTAQTSTTVPANALSIGCYGNGAGQFFNGYIDELRITNGIVRYNSNFTVSSYSQPLSS